MNILSVYFQNIWTIDLLPRHNIGLLLSAKQILLNQRACTFLGIFGYLDFIRKTLQKFVFLFIEPIVCCHI